MSEQIHESISETEEPLSEDVQETEDVEEMETSTDDNVIETEADAAADADEALLDADVSSAEPTDTDLQQELMLAQEEAAKNLEGWQRAAADLKNYKRRQEEQSGRRILDMKANIIKDVLPALDDLDLAFQNLPEDLNEQEANWVEGFKLVQRKLLKLLENNSINTIVSEGEFDPNLHEAVTYEENPDYESNTIIAELRKGYVAGDRVLRPALVRVAQ